MCSLYIEFDYDIVEKTSEEESVEYICQAIMAISELNYKTSKGTFDPKSEKITDDRAKNAGSYLYIYLFKYIKI